MKKIALLATLCFSMSAGASADPLSDQPLPQHQTWSPQAMSFRIPAPDMPNLRYSVQVIGADGEMIATEPDGTGAHYTLSAEVVSGWPDGHYRLSFEPYYTIPATNMSALRRLSDRKDWPALRDARAAAGIPESAALYYFNFRLTDGLFVNPSLAEPLPPGRGGDPGAEPLDYSLTASVDPAFAVSAMASSRLAWGAFSPSLAEEDQVINDDLIVTGSTCIGFDCIQDENFGFTTVRLKENNLRIEFDDTSASAGFPNVDWELMANENLNGGLNLFTIRDRTNDRNILTTEANAPSHSFYIASTGKVGMGTNAPVMKLHVKTGNTPTFRLDQDGSEGWTPQVWDVAGNESNFFIRDVTNGSILPFRIRPNAPSNAIDIKTTAVEINHELIVLGGLLDPSDERLKTNIQPLASVLPVLLQLVPQQYYFRKDGLAAELQLPSQRQYGLVAQEVEQILPELVRESLTVDRPDAEPVKLKSIQYNALIPFLLRGIQEQQAQLAAQQAELAAQQAELAVLRETAARVDRLEQQLAALAAMVGQPKQAGSQE